MRSQVMPTHYQYQSKNPAKATAPSDGAWFKWVLGVLMGLILFGGYLLFLKSSSFDAKAWVDTNASKALTLIMDHRYGSGEFLAYQKEIGLQDCKVFKEDQVFFFNLNPYSGGYGVSYSPTPDRPVWVFSERVVVWEPIEGNWYYWEGKAHLSKASGTAAQATPEQP